MADVYRVKSAFYCNNGDGVPTVYTPGLLVFSDDPIFKGREQFFEPVEVAARRLAGVEEATAEPGALRSVSTAPKRGRPKKVEPEPASLEEE